MNSDLLRRESFSLDAQSEPIPTRLRLGVNIDHVATLREARYRGQAWGEPDPVEAALLVESVGAQGITAHLREDRRHLQDRDLWRLREVIRTRLNFEMANVEEMRQIAMKLRPFSVCLVPEHRMEVTTEGGLNVVGAGPELRAAIEQFQSVGIVVSLFVDPDIAQIKASARLGADTIELHTGAYGYGYRETKERDTQLQRLREAAIHAHELGLKVNAGHGLNVENVPGLAAVPYLEELNIGHHLISRGFMIGLAPAIREMLEAMALYPGEELGGVPVA
jgi:pyridoxine 5-phosphate synthase